MTTDFLRYGYTRSVVYLSAMYPGARLYLFGVHTHTHTKGCYINKKYNDTWLKISWDGNLRIACNFCCMRWYFTVDGDECSDPAPIDSAVFQQQSLNIIRQNSFSGVCKKAGPRLLTAGPKRIQFMLMECQGFGGYIYDAYTGFDSVSRITVEEISPPGEAPPPNNK